MIFFRLIIFISIFLNLNFLYANILLEHSILNEVNYEDLNIKISFDKSSDGILNNRFISGPNNELLFSQLFSYGIDNEVISHYPDNGSYEQIFYSYDSSKAYFIKSEGSLFFNKTSSFSSDGLEHASFISERNSGNLLSKISLSYSGNKLVNAYEVNSLEDYFYSFTSDYNLNLTSENLSYLGYFLSSSYDYNSNNLQTHSYKNTYNLFLTQNSSIEESFGGVVSKSTPNNLSPFLVQMLSFIKPQEIYLDDFGRLNGSLGVFGTELIKKSFTWDLMDRLSEAEIVKIDLVNQGSFVAENIRFSYYPGSRLIKSYTITKPPSFQETTIIVRHDEEELLVLDANANILRKFYPKPNKLDNFFFIHEIIDEENIKAKLPLQSSNNSVMAFVEYELGSQNPSFMVTDSEVLDAFGRPYKKHTNNTYSPSFQGRSHLAGGLYDFRGRIYDSCIASFPQADPMRNGSNWFSFNNNNPYNWTDPSGYFEFMNAENKLQETILMSRPNPAYDVANQLIQVYQKEQDFLINEIENNPLGRLNNCSSEQQNILDELLKQFKSDRKVRVYGKRDFLSNFYNSQGRTTPMGIQLFPRAENSGYPEAQVLFHEAIHVLQYDGVLPREYREKRPEPTQVNMLQKGLVQPRSQAYEQQLWFFGRIYGMNAEGQK